MKKLIAFMLLITLMAVSMVGCGSTPKCFSGEWNFSSISEVELEPNLDQTTLDTLKETYSADNEESLVANAFDKFVADGIFTPCYIKFTSEYTYTYDPVMDREATWKFYELTETTGFISFYSELEVNGENPDPVLYPDLVYNAETDTMSMTINYIGFMVTVDLVR